MHFYEPYLILTILFIIIIGRILVLFIYTRRLASNEIYQEVGRAKDLSAPIYINSPHFMEPEVSLPTSLEPTNCSYPDTNKPIPRHHKLVS